MPQNSSIEDLGKEGNRLEQGSAEARARAARLYGDSSSSALLLPCAPPSLHTPRARAPYVR
eukprot:3218020-Pleurochrysis_carterae.AAC.1